MDIELVATLMFGIGAVALLVNVKRRTQLPFLTLLSLSPKKNLGSIKLTGFELTLAVVVAVVPALLIALSSGLV
jgi:hypothetical protein